MDTEMAREGLPDVPWNDISAEYYREYQMCSGNTLRIVEPLLLHVSASGGHYVIDSRGVTYYVPKDSWDSLQWFNKVNHPRCNFVSPKRGA